MVLRSPSGSTGASIELGRRNCMQHNLEIEIMYFRLRYNGSTYRTHTKIPSTINYDDQGKMLTLVLTKITAKGL